MNDDHITDIPPLSPNADLNELREFVRRLDLWRRAREPVADGGVLPKFIRFDDLVRRGLLKFSPGMLNAGNDVFVVEELIAAGNEPGEPGASVIVEWSVDGLADWHGTFVGGDLYARWKTGATGDWNGPFRVVGETGPGAYFIFKRSAAQPATPTGNNPVGWFDNPPAPDGNPVWVSMGTKDGAGNLVGAWSTPVRIEGTAGAAGTRGSLDLYRLVGAPSTLTSVEADAEVLAQTGSSAKVVGDTVTEYDGDTYVDVLRWDGADWAAPGLVIDGSALVTGTITAGKLATNSVTASKIAAGAVTASKISVSTLDAITANLGSVTAGDIAGSATINISGAAQFGGDTGVTFSFKHFDTGSSVSATAALTANFGLAQDFGIVAKTSQSDGAAVYGYNAYAGGASLGAGGVAGRGTPGVMGAAEKSGTHGVYGKAWSATSGYGVFSDGRLWSQERIVSGCSPSGSAAMDLPVVGGTLPPAVQGGFTLHGTYGPIFSDGANWYRFNAPIVSI